MFNHLSERLNKIVKNLSGQGRLTPENIESTLREIRIALLEADVALPIAKAFIEHIQAKVLGEEVIGSLTPGQALIKLVHQELVAVMGEANESLNFRAEPPIVMLMAGLQGSGKTTTSAKLARWLIDVEKKSVMLVSTDVRRAAAIDQLRTLSAQVGATFHESTPTETPLNIALGAIQAAKKQLIDIILVDTAGRLHIDDEMMAEIKQLHAAIHPVETLFVVDSMSGQDAVNTAKAFNEALPITGIILTKTDGDARGGAALTLRQVTGKPIKFLGIGEKIDALEPFHPERVASRILGMGDILTLVEEAERNVDKAAAAKFAKKIKDGKNFTMNDLLNQLEQINNMGGMMSIMSKLPGMNQLPKHLKDQMEDKKLIRIKAMINSMTRKERRLPDRIKNSHKRRIASGSGTTIQEVNKLLSQFEMMRKMLKKMKGGKLGAMMGMMQNLKGQFPYGG